MDTAAPLRPSPATSASASSIALIACAGLIVLASWLLASVQLYADYKNRVADGQANIANLADVLAEQTISNLEIAGQGITGLANTLQLDRVFDDGTAAQIHSLLERRRIATPNIIEFIITDEHGVLRHASSVSRPQPVDMSAEAFFTTVKNGQAETVYYSSSTVGRSAAAKDRYIFTVSYRLEDKKGAFLGGVQASVDLDQFGRSMGALRLGPNSIVGLVHTDGTLMVRYPDPDHLAGRNYSTLPTVQQMVQGTSSTGILDVPYSSGLRYQAYRKLRNYPFIIYVAVAEQDLLAPWRNNAIAAVIGQSALTLLIGLLTVLVHGALKRRALAETENLRLLREARASAKEATDARDEISRLFAASLDGIVIFDREFRYTFANAAFTAITGTARESFLGRTVYDVAPPTSPLITNLEKCRASGHVVEYENNYTDAKGKPRSVEVRLFPVQDKITAYVRDVSDRRNAEQKLLESQRMDAVGRLAGGMAHDFNNMLSVVVGNVEILLDKLSDPTQTRAAEMVREAAMRGSEIVSRLLSFARRQPLDPKPLNVATVIKEVQNLLRRSLPENVELAFVQNPDLWHAIADAAQLDNALVNLVINARDAMPDGGKITIEATNVHFDQPTATTADIAAGQYVQIAVSDTGSGMPVDVAAKAFEPFFTTKPVGKGTGLGLSMVYGFTRQSGGHVRLYSELGQGTTVKMFLPRAPGISTAPDIKPITEIAPRGSEHILMVEDNDMVRDFVHALLTDLGYAVTACQDAEDTLKVIAGGLKPDMLLSDIVLTGAMNGRQLADKIKETLPHLPVLFMSGYAENAVVHHGRLDAGVQLISKPFRRFDIATRIRAILASRTEGKPQK